jgi:hypothetical protein
MSSASSDFVVVPRDGCVSPRDLVKNDGSAMSARAVRPRAKWSGSAERACVRDGLSDFALDRVVLHNVHDAAPAPCADSQSRLALAAALCDAIAADAAAPALRALMCRCNEADFGVDAHTQREDAVGGVPRALLAPLLLAFVARESSSEAALRRAEYTSAVFRPLSPAAAEMQRDIARDIGRTIPHGFALLFGDARVQKHLARLVLHVASKLDVVGYLQGMCDIAAVLFLTFLEARAASAAPGAGNDVLPLGDVDLIDAEADAAHVFHALITRFLQVFLDLLSGEEMQARMALIAADLAVSNPQLFVHLTDLQVELHLFMHRFHFTFLTRELSARACQRLFLAYLSLPPHVDALRVHSAVCVALLNVVYSTPLLNSRDFEQAVLTAQSSLAKFFDEKTIVDAVFAEAHRVMHCRATFDRWICVRAALLLLRGAAAHAAQL